MIESIGEFEAMVKEGKIWHNGHPVLSWMIDNVHVKVVNGSTRIAKVDPYSYRKVDAVAAALDAFCLARVPEYRPQRSVYEERGVLMI
jgi:phage terminase large subunit-like protein